MVLLHFTICYLYLHYRPILPMLYRHKSREATIITIKTQLNDPLNPIKSRKIPLNPIKSH